MKIKTRFKIFTNLLCTFGFVQGGTAETYVVRQGDTLSQILYNKNFKPIYGKNGFLLKVVEHNRLLKDSKGNILYPGMKISLAVDQNNLIAQDLSVDKNTQVSE
ncbi:MAG: hypothetical protein ACK4VO_02510, partial [Pseudobdellovibrio sp.]